MKYPGAFIINEYGTNKELAKIYGVSERTIYRWKNKAKAETGAKPKKPTRPRTSTLQKFTGTRKELAKKYGVSERTAYRWIKQAKEKGANIPSRRKKAQYPGPEILLDKSKNKELAKKYDVSERTIQRWKNRARIETAESFEVLPPDEAPEELFEVLPPDEAPEEFEDLYEVTDTDINDLDEHTLSNTAAISDLLTSGDMPVLNEDSLFYDLSPDMQLRYIDSYINWQYGQNEHMFYDPSSHSMMYDPEDPNLTSPAFITSLDIWGDQFEEWLSWQKEASDIQL